MFTLFSKRLGATLLIGLAAGLLPTVLAVAGEGDPWQQQAKLIASDGEAFDKFGYSAALDGDTAVVGVPDANEAQGAVYVLVRDGEAWSEQAKLTASDGAAGHEFGTSVAISGDVVVVGALAADAAYLFIRDGGLWSETAKFAASDGASGSQFGGSVAFSGDTVLVGAPRVTVDVFREGAAYVFTRDGESWTEQRLIASDGGSNEFFGTSVALSGDTALVGARGALIDDVNTGAAYVFTRDGGTWTEQAKFAASDSASGDRFGWSVAISGDTALIGAERADGQDSSGGAAYVFTGAGASWSEQDKLIPFSPVLGGSNQRFGASVALSGDTALVGAYQFNVDGVGNQGAAFLYVREGGTWIDRQMLTAADGAANDRFGHSVAQSGGTALAGAIQVNIDGNDWQGAAYVFVNTAAPELSFEPVVLDLGEVPVGEASAPQSATLSNIGDADASGLTFTTPGGGFDVDTADCGETLAAGTDCAVSITFTPAATGAAAATLSADSDQGATADLGLSGEGIEPAELAFSPSSLNFGDVEVGTTSAPQDTTLSNTGDIDAAGLDFSTPGNGFSVLTNECGSVLPAGENCLLSLTFTPDAAGPVGDTLTVEDDGGVSASLNLTGNGEEPTPDPGLLFVTPAVLDFGELPVGDSDTRDITVSNAAPTGNGDLELSNISVSGAAAFALAGGTCNVGTVLAPQQTCSVQVTFNPEDAGDFTAMAMIATTDGQDAAVELEGTGGPQGTGPSTELVSIMPGGGQFGGGVLSSTSSSAMSPDGRYVAFWAHTPGAGTGTDLYRHDRDTGTTEPASVDNNGDWIDANGRAQDAAMTADGRYVLFEGPPSPPWTPEGRGIDSSISGQSWGGIYMRDMEAGDTEFIAIPTTDGKTPEWPLWGLDVSADGRYIAFDTLAMNLLPGAVDGEVYVYDRQTDTLERVAIASDGSVGEDGSSRQPALSADGRYVAFKSFATNLVPDDTNDKEDIFVHDRETGTTERVSVASDGGQANGNCTRPAISADGRFVAFMSRATTLVPGDTYPEGEIFIHDRATGTTEQVSVASDGGPANNTSNFPVISADGRYVGFMSTASNLVPDDTNGQADVFVRDRETGSTERVSVASDGSQGNGWSNRPGGISADGRFVAFLSDATNLVSNDGNGKPDIFVRDRIGGPPPLPDRIFDDSFEGQ